MSDYKVTVDHDAEPCPQCGKSKDETPSCEVKVSYDTWRLLEAMRRIR